MSDDHRDQQLQPPESQEPPPGGYEPPRVEELPTEGPAVTAAGESQKKTI